MLRQSEDAVSPVIGVILMVVIGVILATVVAVFAFQYGGTETKGPTASIQILNVPETTNIIDMKIVHKGGDSLKAGDWKLSIVKTGDPPVYITASSDFRTGDQIITTNLTSSGTITVTNRSVTVSGTAATLDPDTKYDVKIIVFPYRTITVDAVVSLR